MAELKISLVDTIKMHDSISGILKDPSAAQAKRARVEFFFGDQRRVSKRDWVEKKRLIDRKNSRYSETVKYLITGEVLHRTEERLSEHKGHGSAKL